MKDCVISIPAVFIPFCALLFPPTSFPYEFVVLQSWKSSYSAEVVQSYVHKQTSHSYSIIAHPQVPVLAAILFLVRFSTQLS